MLLLLEKYDVKYIVLMDEWWYWDIATLGGGGLYKPKPYTNDQYRQIFSSYKFLEVKYTNAGTEGQQSLNPDRH